MQVASCQPATTHIITQRHLAPHESLSQSGGTGLPRFARGRNDVSEDEKTSINVSRRLSAQPSRVTCIQEVALLA